MSKATEAADLLRLFFKNFEAAATVIPMLEQAGSLENSIAEKTAISESLMGQIDTLRDQVAGMQRDLEDARTAADATVKAAEARAAEIVSEAEQRAEGIAEAAVVAQEAADATLAEVAAQTETARAELATLEQKKAETEAAIAAELEAARKRLGG